MNAASLPRSPRLRTYLRLGRVSNLPTVWTNALAGTALASFPDRPAPATVAVLALACSLAYIGGMFLNDAFDRAIDARERPDRPIPAGLIGAREVFAVGFALLGAGVLLVGAHTLSGAPIASALALSGAIVLYDAWHKGNPVGPLLMGTCRVLVYVTCALAVAPRLGTSVLTGAGLLLSYLIGLTYLAKHEGAYLAGRMPALSLRRFWPLALLFVPFVVMLPTALASAPVLAVYVLFLAWVVFALVRLRSGRPGAVPRTVVRLIAGISLLDALLIAPWAGSLAGIAAFGLTLWLQRYVSGT
ncbi:UbiA family prenyltransferase [Pendulispora albinea]|uniref:UbiA family prenyltransferase n=1 Tax=Pendulispora albinea TaxID=2741071 RepID=A0ABZ2LXF1_9BACT